MSEILYKVIPQTASSGWLEKKCYWCGEYFQKGEKLALVVIAFEYKKIYKKLSSNVIMHESEFNQLVSDCNGDQEKIVIALGEHKQKRVSCELTADQKKATEAFQHACKLYGFCTETTTKDEVHMRKHGTSLTMVYNIHSGRIEITDKIRKKGMFDGLFTREIEAKIYNKMQEELGTGLHDDYTAAKVVTKAVEETNKLFGK